MWYDLGRQVAGRNYPPTNKNTLIRALTEEWDKLPQQLLDNVVQSMSMFPGRCNTGLTTPRHAEHQIINLILGNITPLNKQWPPKFR
ncbi:hypothetical protein TNCV_4874311 [Trichonephila clavipes]|nr:hypothetical protein TNCV_4874311 [Trichonephila clavipes]